MELQCGVYKVLVTNGGTGYTGAPTVAFNGGGGTGVSATVQMAGTVVQAVQIINGGTGFTAAPTVSFTGASGTGAAATAAVLVQSTQVCMFKGRFNDMYGVDGVHRGFRWDGENAYLEPLGIARPLVFTAPTGSTTSASGRVVNVQVVAGGAGYKEPPTVTFEGGTPAVTAAGVASIQNGQVVGITITNRGLGYQATPKITFSGGQGSSAAFSVGVIGGLAGVVIEGSGAGYTGLPTLSYNNTGGLTGANVGVVVDTNTGKLVGTQVYYSGTGATTTGATIGLTGGGATTHATLTPVYTFRISAITVANSGSGFLVPPVITILPHPEDTSGGGALVEAGINSAGNITGVTILSGGQYRLPPTAVIGDSSAKALATIGSAMKGKYLCAVRYLDDTTEAQAGPIPSSISDLREVDCTTGVSSLTWTFNHNALESRVQAIELWRTTADQRVALYRVARIDKVDGVLPTDVYVDTLSDNDLLDPSRTTATGNIASVYGFMPIVLPSGQPNARRFNPPPEKMQVACMFQDRAWYAADTTGKKANSLFYSEIDEPESVHPSNEIVIQENAGDSDAIVGLIPLGAALIVAQSRHLYKLAYVAQPIFDASIQLVSYRGMLNKRCYDVIGGTAFIADSYGLYAFDGGQEEAISAPIDNYWRDNLIDFTKAANFWVKADVGERVVRFFYCQTGDSGNLPKRALCYGIATRSWWEETYPQGMGHGSSTPLGTKQGVIYGAESGGFLKTGGLVDATAAGGTTSVPYHYRTPPRTLMTDQMLGASPVPEEKAKSRSISILYTPTTSSATVGVGVHFNNSTTARTNAIDSNRGTGFTTIQGSSMAVIDMAATRSSLGDANGRATASFAGRLDDRSHGADRHIAVGFTGAQTSNAVKIHGITIAGVG